jgi:hypothetical protein
MGKTKDLSAFERVMVVGARCTGLSVSRTAKLLFFLTLNSFLCVSRMIHHTKDIPANFTQLGINGVNMSQPPCRMLSMPCIVHAPMN